MSLFLFARGSKAYKEGWCLKGNPLPHKSALYAFDMVETHFLGYQPKSWVLLLPELVESLALTSSLLDHDDEIDVDEDEE